MTRAEKIRSIKPEIWWMWAHSIYGERYFLHPPEHGIKWPTRRLLEREEETPFTKSIPVRVLLTPVVGKETA